MISFAKDNRKLLRETFVLNPRVIKLQLCSLCDKNVLSYL